MIRFSLKTLPSVADCMKALDEWSALFVKTFQRKPIVDLLISTTFSSVPTTPVRRPAPLVGATYAPSKDGPESIHEVTLMVDDKTERETPPARLAAEVSWFRAQGFAV